MSEPLESYINTTTNNSEGDEEYDGLPAPPRSNGNTPQRQRSGSLSDSNHNRPRSNPRTRTNRWDSPVPMTMNRMSIREEENNDEDFQARTTTIRYSAGLASGNTSIHNRIRTGAVAPSRRQSSQHKISKQAQPSKHKIRRWNNDNFVGVASELAKSNINAAEAFLRGEADKAEFLDPHYPLCYNSSFSRLIKEPQLQSVKDKFINGEVAKEKPVVVKRHDASTGLVQFRKMNKRLKNAIIRTCSTSTHYTTILSAFESYLRSIFLSSSFDDTTIPVPHVLKQVLHQSPVIDMKKRYIQFQFMCKLSTTSFHRLLLHAVCDFHKLTSSSSSSSNQENLKTVSVSGTVFHHSECYLASYVIQEQKKDHVVNNAIVDSMSTLKVS